MRWIFVIWSSSWRSHSQCTESPDSTTDDTNTPARDAEPASPSPTRKTVISEAIDFDRDMVDEMMSGIEARLGKQDRFEEWLSERT